MINLTNEVFYPDTCWSTKALAERRLVVAFESTIIPHRMPYLENVQIAFGNESIVKENEAVPATMLLL